MLLISSSKDNNSDEQIGEIEVFDSKLQYRKTTLLTEIINIGIDASLDRKKRNVKDKKKFSDLVKSLLHYLPLFNLQVEILFRIIEEDENIVISDYDKGLLLMIVEFYSLQVKTLSGLTVLFLKLSMLSTTTI